MGQATLDLPDPTQLSGLDAEPLSPEALASADDLLSQLAGDDIDRLLAEAEAERPPVAAVLPAVEALPEILAAEPVVLPEAVADEAIAAVIDDAAEATTAAALDAILAPAIETVPLVVESPVAIPAESSEAVIAPIVPSDDPAVELQDQKVLEDAAAHVAAIMEPPAPAPAPVPASAPDLAAAHSAETTAERKALAEPLIVAHADKKPSVIIAILIRILELMNSPMQFIPDVVRDAIGKVALLTTFNAAAVIVYVMVFRRPHH